MWDGKIRGLEKQQCVVTSCYEFGCAPSINMMSEFYLFCCRHAGEGIYWNISPMLMGKWLFSWLRTAFFFNLQGGCLLLGKSVVDELLWNRFPHRLIATKVLSFTIHISKVYQLIFLGQFKCFKTQHVTFFSLQY